MVLYAFDEQRGNAMASSEWVGGQAILTLQIPLQDNITKKTRENPKRMSTVFPRYLRQIHVMFSYDKLENIKFD